MAADPAFDIVAQLTVEQEGFTRDLKKAEAVVKKSADSMSGSIQQIGGSADLASASLDSASIVATAMGGSMAVAAGGARSLAAAITSIKVAMGPVAIAIAAVTAVLGFLAGAVSKAIGEENALADRTKLLRDRNIDLALTLRQRTDPAFSALAAAQTRLTIASKGLSKEQQKLLSAHHNLLQEEIALNKADKERVRLTKEINDGIEKRFAAETKLLDAKKQMRIELVASQEADALVADSNRAAIEAIKLQADLVAGRKSEFEVLVQIFGIARAVAQLDLNREIKLKELRGKRSSASEALDKFNARPEETSGFSIGTQQSSQFRGFQAGSNIVLGQQTEQKKTNELLEENNRLLNQIRNLDEQIAMAENGGLN